LYTTLSIKDFTSSMECQFCHKRWDAKGFGNHRRACEKKYLLDLQQMEYEKMKASRPINRKFYFISAAEYFKILELDIITYYNSDCNVERF
jgi:hypothetical protein